MTTQLNLNFDAARARGDLGAERAASRAERAAPGWVDRAVEALRDYVRQNALGMSGQFTVEQARTWAENMGLPKPTDGRAWGQVTRRAVSLGIIETTGGYAKAASSNGSVKALYRRGSLA